MVDNASAQSEAIPNGRVGDKDSSSLLHSVKYLQVEGIELSIAQSARYRNKPEADGAQWRWRHYFQPRRSPDLPDQVSS